MGTEVQTVLGPVDAKELKQVLPHEHVLVYRQGHCPVPVDETLQQQVVDHLCPMYRRLVEEFHCNTIIEVTPTAMARDPGLMATVARASGMHIVCATGYYTAQRRPPDFERRSIADLADEMIRELTEGIGGTGIKAGIIKIGTSNWQPSDRLLCAAAAIAQRETGCSITTHTCSPSDRRGVLDYLEGAGVPPERIYLGHADANGTALESLALLQRGCNLLYTIWGIQDPRPIGWRQAVLPKYHSAELVSAMVAEGYAGQVLISIDYAPHFEEPGKLRTDHLYGVEGRTSLYMYTHVLGWLREKFGLNDTTLEQIMVDNPRRSLVWQPA